MEKKRKSRASNGSKDNGQLYFINGVKVPFPVKAYPTQITMMHKILRGLDKKQNCLLESPTGSGKTLALLCSCLAWQRTEKEKYQELMVQAEQERRNRLIQELMSHEADNLDNILEGRNTADNLPRGEFKSETGVVAASETSFATNVRKNEQIQDADADEEKDDDLDFQAAKKRFRTPTGGIPIAKRQKRSINTNQEVSSSTNVDNMNQTSEMPTWKIETNAVMKNVEDGDNVNRRSEEKAKKLLDDYDDDCEMEEKEIPRTPKIFFGTRTHKQIAQIVRELKKTDFRTARMTILSSREHTCIHPVVSKGRDKNEECRRHVKGMDGKVCKFHGNAALLCRTTAMEKYKLDVAWDIEDLVKAGKKAKACPYYAAREMMDHADIIFCPYNYLVAPGIREQMNINLKDEVVVLDEAHNIEDSAREAASVSITSSQFQDMMEELDKLVLFRIMVHEHQCLRELCSKMFNWLESLSDILTNTGFETARKILTGFEMAERMHLIQITPETFPIYKNMMAKVVSAETEQITDIDAPKLSTKSQTLLQNLMIALEKVLGKENEFNEDFRIAISKKAEKARRPEATRGGWKNSYNKVLTKTWVYSLNFWCLNPAVVFSGIGRTARCIVLTSGTLSPMNSFSSELGVAFPIQLEANHVIADSQVWVGALTVGTDNRNLIANYQSSETFSFQDEVGKVVLQICQTVPRGVLCFFPSYSMLDKLKRRWMNTGLWEQLHQSKMVFSEPRGSDRSELDDVMGQFYGAARDETNESCTGALLFAVCRGKVSEGLDFTDDNARAVITIGIPFPDFKDTQVELKRKYNDKHSSTRGLLTGAEWYEIQAYRALNQALGRCIRHKKDWGAILLVDERFGRGEKYKKGLSRWVRGRCKTYTEFKSCSTSLASFAEARRLNPCPEPVETPGRTEVRTPVTPNVSVIDGGQTPAVGGCLDSICQDSCKSVREVNRIVEQESDATDRKESHTTVGMKSCSAHRELIVLSEGKEATVEGNRNASFRTDESYVTSGAKSYATGCKESHATSKLQSTSTIVRPFDSATPVIKRECSVPKNLKNKLDENQGLTMQFDELQNLDHNVKIACDELPQTLKDKQTHKLGAKGTVCAKVESISLSSDIVSREGVDKDGAVAENLITKSSTVQSKGDQTNCDLRNAITTPTFKSETEQMASNSTPLSVLNNSLTKPRYNSFDNLIKPVLTGHNKLFRTNRLAQAAMAGQGRLFKSSQAEREASDRSFENKMVRENHINLLDVDDGFLEDLDAENVCECDRALSKSISEIGKSKSKVSERKIPIAKVETPVLFSEEENEIGDFEDKFWDGVDDTEMNKVLSESAERIDRKENEDKSLQKRTKSSKIKKKGLIDTDVDVGRDEEEYENVPRVGKAKSNFAQNDRCDHQSKEKLKPNNALPGHDSKKCDTTMFGDSKNEVVVDCGEENDLLNTSRRRSSSRKKSNVRMASKKVEPGDMQNGSIGVRDDVYKATLSCPDCHKKFTKNVKIRYSRIVPRMLSKFAETQNGPPQIIETSFESLKNWGTLDCEHSCSCNSELSDLQCNAIYSNEDETVYVPLFCKSCHKRNKVKQRLIGFRLVKFGQSTKLVEETTAPLFDAYVLPSAVTEKQGT